MIFKNLRPISNLTFISKLLECVVCKQLRAHLATHGLEEIFKSAYKENHSVETAILSVYNDMVRAIDRKKSVVLVLLDLSAAFDTVDHGILLEILCKRVGVSGVAIKWFASYLKGRSQYVTVNNISSKPTELKCGVPQGSVLGPLLFTTYLLPLGDTLRAIGVDFHFFADDQQIYMEFSIDETQHPRNMEKCLSSILSWLKQNFMSCNTNKTEMIIISSSHGPTPPLFNITFNGDIITPSKQVRNLGVIFDKNLNMESHVNKVCQAGYFHLRNI